MKRAFFAIVALSAMLCAGAGTQTAAAQSAPATEIYEWRIYTLADEAGGALLDEFFRDHLIPAYNRYGVEVGVFAPAADYREFPAGGRYMLVAWPDMETFHRVSRQVRDDAGLATGGAGYFDASAKKPAYTNVETYLCEQLSHGPKFSRPGAGRELLEFRVYRSPNMEANERKIKMFEQGEIATFDKTGVNGVFYGRTLAGPRMASLAYLTWYTGAEARREAWDKFGAHPDWVAMRGLPQYANTATDNTIRLLTPMPWSQY